MMLRCKFRVDAVIPVADARRLKLSACNSTKGDNADWSKWTPCGTFEITVTNEAEFPTIDAMKPGDIYWISLSPVNE